MTHAMKLAGKLTSRSRSTADLTIRPFGFRMRPELKAALEQAAAQQGRSINSEIAARLEESFNDERALGGPPMRWLVTLVVAAFTVAGRLRAPGDPDPLRNREVYKSGMFAAIDALLAALPDATPEEVAQEIETLEGRLLSRVAREQMGKRPV
jgi:hypothetical protein